MTVHGLSATVLHPVYFARFSIPEESVLYKSIIFTPRLHGQYVKG
jgi:hypothetical protein